jgi:hypothetical protein
VHTPRHRSTPNSAGNPLNEGAMREWRYQSSAARLTFVCPQDQLNQQLLIATAALHGSALD